MENRPKSTRTQVWRIDKIVHVKYYSTIRLDKHVCPILYVVFHQLLRVLDTCCILGCSFARKVGESDCPCSRSSSCYSFCHIFVTVPATVPATFPAIAATPCTVGRDDFKIKLFSFSAFLLNFVCYRDGQFPIFIFYLRWRPNPPQART